MNTDPLINDLDLCQYARSKFKFLIISTGMSTEQEIEDCILAAKAVNGHYVAVDFIPAKNRDNDRPYIIEVNSMPGFGGIEKLDTKKSLTQDIFKYFMIFIWFHSTNFNIKKRF